MVSKIYGQSAQKKRKRKPKSQVHEDARERARWAGKAAWLEGQADRARRDELARTKEGQAVLDAEFARQAAQG